MKCQIQHIHEMVDQTDSRSEWPNIHEVQNIFMKCLTKHNHEMQKYIHEMSD